MVVNKNSEILFLYDARMSNPNGDMDNENKPRMDYDTDTNLVSDVRLKRYVRDYFEQSLGKEIFVTGKAEKAQNRTEAIVGKGKVSDEDLEKIVDTCYDIRFFGVVLGTTGGNTHLTGPVQFNWGYSLNPVEINESSTITSSFSSGEGVGKDYRVKYSLIAFNGSVNANVAEDTKMQDEDLVTFDNALLKAIPLNKTRSKEGQYPRLYLRVELKDKDIMLKDLREYLSIKERTDNKYEIRSCDDYIVDFNKLNSYLNEKADQIDTIHLWKDDKINIDGWKELMESFDSKINELKL